MSATRTKPFGVPTAKQSSAGNLSQHTAPAALPAPTPQDGQRRRHKRKPNEIRPCSSDPTAVEIVMTDGIVAVVDADMAAAVSVLYWAPVRAPNATYARGTLEGDKKVYLHRFLWRTWAKPEARYLDHRDRDGLNCRQGNLRPATPSQNGSNRKPTQPEAVKTSRFKGVSRKRGKNWTALIGVNGKYIHLGTFAKEEDAAAAYREAAIKYHGEFARTEW